MAKASNREPRKSKKKSRQQNSGDKNRLMQALRSYVRTHAPKLLEDPNVTSVGIGYKDAEGTGKPQLAIKFTVESKVAPERIESLGSTPIPKAIEVAGVQVPTEVIERIYKPSYRRIELESKDDRKVRADVMRPGMSVGAENTPGGSIGTFVRDIQSGKTVLLSNWHVLQGPAGALGDMIVQPGKHDDNRVELNVIGQLMRSHLGAAGDCAIASVTGRKFSSDVLELGVVVSAIGDPEIGDKVVKSGRTTGVTRGIVVRIEVNTKINYGGGVSANVGGFEIGPDSAVPAKDNEISRAGDSGSVWLAVDKKKKPTGVMLGLHFAGDADDTAAEFALACYAKSVMMALEVEPAGAVAVESTSSLADGQDLRDGFDRQFISFAIGAPRFIKSREKDLAMSEEETELRYCHFSLWLSKARKYPLCVAWNIDGNRFKRLNRASFRTDRRGDLEKYQLTDDIYVHNPFDKGHIARRADLCWGTLTEARQGNYDSFYYTNIAPQHEAFNQSGNRDDDPEGGPWGRLENTVFDSENPHDLRISAFGGPVFGSKDRAFVQNGEECLVPAEFWKIIAYTDDSDGKEKAYGFLLTQKHLVDPLTVPEGLDFEPWVWARITLRDLESKTGIRFPKALHDREVSFTAPQTIGDGPVLRILSAPSEYFN